MSFYIRKFDINDFEKIKVLNNDLYFKIKNNKTFNIDNCFVAISNLEKVIGVCALAYDGTWFYLESKREDIPSYRMQIELFVDDISCKKEVEVALVNEAKKHIQKFKNIYPDKKLCMRCFVLSNQKDEIQFWLEQGFSTKGIMWIFDFDLKKTIPIYECNENISIEKIDFSTEKADYLKANELGFFGVQDAENELSYRVFNCSALIFCAKKENEIVSSVTIWEIENKKVATENIFTIPNFRRKNICRKTLAFVLKYLKEKGYEVARLTCESDNDNAISLYFDMGYKYKNHFIELCFQI